MNDDDIEELIRREYGRVVASVALILGGERDRAEDFVQDALLTLWSRRLAPDNPGAWLTVAASNRARSWWRRTGREGRAFERVVARDQLMSPASGHRTGSDGELGPAIGGLSLRQRQVVVLFYEYELPVGEIARTLGISPGSVKTFLHRARQALAASMSIEVPDGDR